MARVLITRPLEAARKTAALARALGHEPLLAPVLAIRAVALEPPSLEGVQAVLVTSRHAVAAAARIAERRPLYAVGEGTAAALAGVGASPVAVADGDGVSLARLVADRLDPRGGALLHPTGEVVAGGLIEGVEAAGFVYRPWVVYAADPVPRLPAAIAADLDAGRIDAVTFHSPRSGRIFAELLRAGDRESVAADVVALALSANVAAALGGLKWHDLRIAPRPDERGMGALLEDLRL